MSTASLVLSVVVDTPGSGANAVLAVGTARNFEDTAGSGIALGSVRKQFHDQTEAGKAMLAARTAMREQGAPRPMRLYLTPGNR